MLLQFQIRDKCLKIDRLLFSGSYEVTECLFFIFSDFFTHEQTVLYFLISSNILQNKYWKVRFFWLLLSPQ